MSASASGAAPDASAGVAVSRRRLVGWLGATLAGTLSVSACGGSARSSRRRQIPPTPQAADDARMLNRLLAGEYQAIAAYTAAAPLLSGNAALLARQFLGQEVLHADRLISLIRHAGGRPRQSKPSYNLGHPRSARQVINLLLQAERTQLAAYLDTGPLLSSGSLRAVAGSILATQAQHAALWRTRLGEVAAPTAFVGAHD